MASDNVGNFVNAFNPMDLIKGFEFGQKAQRDEEKAFADIENQRLRNDLLGTTIGEFKGAGQTEQRSTATELQTLLNKLGITTGGYNLDVAQQQGGTIKEGLTAQTQAATTNAKLQAERANLGLDLFPDQATIAKAVGAQDVSLLPETLKIREAGQKEKAGTIDASLRRLDELTLQSGAVDTLRKAYADNPNAAPFDVMLAAYKTAPDNQKAVIAARMQIQHQRDLVAVNNPEALDQWLQRPLQPFKGRAWVLQDGRIAFATETGRVNEQGQKTYGEPSVARDMEEAKNLLGQRVPAGTRQPTTKAAPITGAGLGAIAGGGSAAPPASTPATSVRGAPVQTPVPGAPAAAPAAPLAPAAAPVNPAAAAAQPSVDQMIQQATARINQLTQQREQMIGANAPTPTTETWKQMVPIEQELNSLQGLISRMQQQEQQSVAQRQRQQNFRGARLGFQPPQ
jgi:hypothetical protein